MPPKRRNQHENISTHAPLAGRDQEGKQAYGSNEQFQPTRPLRGATDIRLDIRLPQKQFQPTRPLRGATTSFVMSTTISRAISTHAPLAGRDGVVAHIAESPAISTHAPLAGRDPRPRPRRGSTKISTHAPLAGRDRRGLHREEDNYYFNPRAPCGARQLGTEYRNKGQKIFQPTRPLRGATRKLNKLSRAVIDFNPRAPCGARRIAMEHRPEGGQISTHAPLAGRDSKSVQITMHIFAITDKFQMLLHRMPPVRAFCSFLMQENHADFGCEPPK